MCGWPMWESIGAIVLGRHLFDLVNGWEGRPPAGDHVVVVSHRPKRVLHLRFTVRR
jgi:hypothetical protein